MKAKEKNCYCVRIINLDEGRTVREQIEFETLREAISFYDYLTENEIDCFIELNFYDQLDPRNCIGFKKNTKNWRGIDCYKC